MTIVTIGFEDRNYWIKRVDVVVKELESSYDDRFEERVKEYAKLSWFVRKFLLHPPVRHTYLENCGHLISFKKLLEMGHWQSIDVEYWILRQLSE